MTAQNTLSTRQYQRPQKLAYYCGISNIKIWVYFCGISKEKLLVICFTINWVLKWEFSSYLAN